MAASLSSVVSDLVRASMGTSVPSTVTDEELDKCVKELLMKEAKKREESYGQRGIRAYLASSISDSNAPKPNKRFLSSIIRSTDDHNKSILRTQSLAAQEIKREREESERRDRRARAEEAVAAEKERLRKRGSSNSSSRSKRRSNEDEGWDKWDGRSADRKRQKRDWETWDGHDEAADDRYRHRRHRHRSRTPGRHRHDDDSRRSRRHRSNSPERSSRRRKDDKHSSKVKSRRSRSRSSLPDEVLKSKDPPRTHASSSHTSISDDAEMNPSTSRRRQRSRSHTLDHDDASGSRADSSSSGKVYREDELRQQLLSRRDKNSYSKTVVEKPTGRSPNLELYRPVRRSRSRDSSLSSMSMSRSPTPGPQPVHNPPSKMDKYFEESYDPRLDVAPLSAPNVPSTGLINNAEFAGWDAMLDLLRQRKEDKDEKKRLQRLGLDKDDVKKAKTTSQILSSMNERWSSQTVSIMDIEYKKKGAIREWDLGKEGF